MAIFFIYHMHCAYYAYFSCVFVLIWRMNTCHTELTNEFHTRSRMPPKMQFPHVTIQNNNKSNKKMIAVHIS